LSNGAGSVTEKVNALLYFESIIVNSNVSNRLINSAFLSLLLKLLKTSSSKSPPLRTRICSVLGLLIRHSTVIENEVAESDLCLQLVEVLTRERNEKVRRKAVAALGEYMFYAATQLDEEGAEACWEIREDAINAIIKCLRVETSMPVSPEQMPTDETVVFYAVKTLENITA
jgi:serine/threonine-protein kinase ULK4